MFQCKRNISLPGKCWLKNKPGQIGPCALDNKGKTVENFIRHENYHKFKKAQEDFRQ